MTVHNNDIIDNNKNNNKNKTLSH